MFLFRVLFGEKGRVRTKSEAETELLLPAYANLYFNARNRSAVTSNEQPQFVWNKKLDHDFFGNYAPKLLGN